MRDFGSLIARFRSSGLLIDTILLLLLCVGSVDPGMIAKHKRIHAYTRSDFELLSNFVDRFDWVVTTPNILTEVSNLVVYGEKEPRRSKLVDALRALLIRFHEDYRRSSEVAGNPAFLRFGLTDACIGIVAADRHLVLTDDLKLASHLASIGVNCVNFNHLFDDSN